MPEHPGNAGSNPRCTSAELVNLENYVIIKFFINFWKLKGLAILATATALQSRLGSNGGRLVRALNPLISKNAKTKQTLYKPLIL